MLTLGIETSGPGGGVALADNRRCLAERSLPQEGRRHARMLVSEIRTLLHESLTPLESLDAVAVSIGPGSFTGLRVGVVCAKTLAYALSVPLVAVDTFLAIAAQSPAEIAHLQVIGDGQRGDLYVGRYQRFPEDGWRSSAPIDIQSAEAWLQTLVPSDVATGPGLFRHESEAARRCSLLPVDCREPRAATVAILGEDLAAQGRAADIRSIEPFYLRRSGAEEKADLKDSARPARSGSGQN